MNERSISLEVIEQATSEAIVKVLERYGIKALGEWLAAQTGVEVVFADLYNPA